MSPRTGRPKSENPKSAQIAVRLDEATLYELETVAKFKKITRVEAIRQGIKIQYERLKK